MNKYSELAKELKKIKGLRVTRDELLSKHTTFRIGGRASIFVVPDNESALIELIKGTRGIKKYVIGNGSNLLLPDSGIKGLVVKISGNMKDFCVSGRMVEAGSGLHVQTLIGRLSHLGLSGLEFAAGVPAAVGGAVSMNMGAKGEDTAGILDHIFAIDKNGKKIELSGKDLKFGYRESGISGCVITKAVFRMKHRTPSLIRKEIEENLKWRRAVQPISVPSAGSVFKNPKDVPAGKLIDMASLKGARVGDAEVSRKHGNFIINVGEAKARDVSALIKKIQRTVKEQFRVGLALELIDSKRLTVIF